MMPCCAHLKVEYRRKDESSITSEWWECVDCTTHFVPDVPFVDDRGVTYNRPTAWAWAQICKVLEATSHYSSPLPLDEERAGVTAWKSEARELERDK